jgi:hypothetical protein
LAGVLKHSPGDYGAGSNPVNHLQKPLKMGVWQAFESIIKVG